MTYDVDAANIIKGANKASLVPSNGAAVSFLLLFSLVRCSMSRDDLDFASPFWMSLRFWQSPRKEMRWSVTA
jgi:hypothetical protein